MYIPKHFKVEDKQVIYDFIEKNSFGILVSSHNGVPYATNLPLVLDRDQGYLYGHFARPNTQWLDIEEQEILVIFQGPHHYISSSWYETNESVPTWNYVAVHVYGRVERIDDRTELLHGLKELVSKYEEMSSSYTIDEQNQSYVDKLIQGIVGFRLKINRLEGKWKLSQNHSAERKEMVIEQLNLIGTDHAKEIANLMKERMK
ncbi:FMN-binding negative transcriptional regulator [Paenibacillus albiflavus]|uniref:FMN-binding negative transcriptional regulator n=1 Tax=Paenibacillus albiflavus TaxID=2545760 RepID=A0A4R4EJJ7_9BACL|nr:FMN-binding negative transcriptional regulator [Paenibacillus albiflavus]TCZ80139.1 FMN-binding negative transcriptional regulator [Paenibacillus albiflavus]